MADEIIISGMTSLTPKRKAEHEPFEYIKHEVTRRGQSDCYVCFYEIPPLKSAYPYHYHTANTEVFYIISGSGTLITPDGERNICAGSVIVCPPGRQGAHRIYNASHTDTLVYLDCDTANSPDIVFYPDSGKLGAIITGEESRFFEENAEVDYYKNE